MAANHYKWFLSVTIMVVMVVLASFATHPIYVSVTEIEHNKTDKTLEISCKLFTDDFEKTLRKGYRQKIDLIKPANKAEMEKVIFAYINSHLKLYVNGNAVALKYLGYEIEEEGVVSYLQADGIVRLQKMHIENTLLYEYSPQQMGIMHVKVNGKRQSSRLNNPDTGVDFVF